MTTSRFVVPTGVEGPTVDFNSWIPAFAGTTVLLNPSPHGRGAGGEGYFFCILTGT